MCDLYVKAGSEGVDRAFSREGSNDKDGQPAEPRAVQLEEMMAKISALPKPN